MMQQDKLVRDRIPEIITESGRTCRTRTVSGDELYAYLDRKLDEETAEFRESKNVEELADILEVVIGLANAIGCSEEELFAVRQKKKDERGAFLKGMVLEDTERILP
ncbi:MAG: nucleoside triphosphate pyrophosphohydrolase [archaeon]|nr:nucleoside triphosphate pyrophosphohydrolase [archaeon]